MQHCESVTFGTQAWVSPHDAGDRRTAGHR
jgi:hypothetical protein